MLYILGRKDSAFVTTQNVQSFLPQYVKKTGNLSTKVYVEFNSEIFRLHSFKTLL